MSKLITVIVAAMFAAVSVPALAASHAGAKGDKMEKKMEKKKGEGKKKAASKKKMDKMDKK